MFGTELLDNFFLQIDPLEWAAKIPTSFAKVNLSTSGSKANFDKEVNKITKKAYGALQTNLGDITKEKQPRVALEVENWVITCMEEVRQYTDADNWEMQYNARTTPDFSDLSKVHGGKNEEGTEFTFAWQKPISEFDTGSASTNVGTDYLRFDVTFTKIAAKDKTTAVECVLYGGVWTTGSKEATIDLGVSTADATITGNTGRGKVEGNIVDISFTGSKLIVKFQDQKNKFPNSLSEITEVTGLYYSFGGKSHAIKTININGDQGGSITFKPKNGSSSVNSWHWGEGPSNKAGTDSTKSNDDDDDNEDDNNEPETKDPNDLVG